MTVAELAQPRFSVVVPVYDEHENIGEFCRTARRMFPSGHEVLICYDYKDDTTLSALEELDAEELPHSIRLVHNRRGPGVRFAIEAGMRAARAPVVVVTMVDLSDDYKVLDQMVELAERGAAVVCASRYMRGGRQLGGPPVKVFLSRLAGVSLHHFTTLPTHDPTNSFKSYRKDFLESVTIESSAGFSLGLELCVKAHFGGWTVQELPATWTDRQAGRSRFRLLQWLPTYLRWYLLALWWEASGRRDRRQSLTLDEPRNFRD